MKLSFILDLLRSALQHVSPKNQGTGGIDQFVILSPSYNSFHACFRVGTIIQIVDLSEDKVRRINQRAGTNV